MRRATKTAAEYLELMTDFAILLRDSARDRDIHLAGWAADKRYVRINGGGLRVVSLCADSPCGKVQGQNVRKTVGGLTEAARKAKIPKGEPKAKPEHRWQAALIEHALRWPDALPDVLKLRDACDELRLVTDELSVPVMGGVASQTIRADVVFVGRKGTTWFPVYVELKVKRSLHRLLQQLQNIASVANLDERTRDAFKKFLATGIPQTTPAPEIDLDRSLKVIIWPSTERVSTRINTAFALGIRVLEFPDGTLPPSRFDSPELSLTPAVTDTDQVDAPVGRHVRLGSKADTDVSIHSGGRPRSGQACPLLPDPLTR